MNLVEWLQGLMTSFGASWVMWLMIFLSVISVAIMLERGWFYFSLRDDIPKLATDLRRLLREGDDEAMQGAAALQRMKLERRLAYLGTLGNNAPFIGLFGTVIGVVQAFEQLGKQGMTTAQSAASAAPTQVMSAIAEALVATAVGLVVAIPAVAMNNFYQRISRSILANTDALSHVLLSYLAGVEAGHAPPPPATLAGASKADKAKAKPSARGDVPPEDE